MSNGRGILALAVYTPFIPPQRSSMQMFYKDICNYRQQRCRHFVFRSYSLFAIGLISQDFVLLLTVLGRIQATRQRRYSVRSEDIRAHCLLLLKESGEALLTLFLRGNELFLPSFSNQFLFWLLLASNGQQPDHICLRDRAELWVLSSHISLPVWVICQVCCWKGDWVVIAVWIDGTWRRVAELGIKRNTSGTAWIDSKPAVNCGPNTCRLDGILL